MSLRVVRASRSFAGEGARGPREKYRVLPKDKGIHSIRAGKILLLVEFPTSIQVVKIQNCVEDEEVAALGLATPHRVG